MSEDWQRFVRWPACSTCEGRGYFVDVKTAWPVECRACAADRKDAVQIAQKALRDWRTRGQ